MKRMLKYFIFFLIIPCVVTAKNINGYVYMWEKDSLDSYFYNIGETKNDIIIYNNNGFLESYNKKTGDKKSVKLGEKFDTLLKKINDKYVVFEKKYDHYENGVAYHNVKLTLYNDKLEVIKQREYISPNYFVDMYEKDNKTILIDYSGNEFVLDENLEVTPYVMEEDGSYFLLDGNSSNKGLFKYSKDNELLNSVIVDGTVVYFKKDGYYILHTLKSTGLSSNSPCEEEFYLLDSDLNILHKTFEVTKNYCYHEDTSRADGNYYSYCGSLGYKRLDVIDEKIVLTSVESVPDYQITKKEIIEEKIKNELKKDGCSLNNFVLDYKIDGNDNYFIYAKFNNVCSNNSEEKNMLFYYNSDMRKIWNVELKNEIVSIFVVYDYLGVLGYKNGNVVIDLFDNTGKNVNSFDTGHSSSFESDDDEYISGYVEAMENGIFINLYSYTALPQGSYLNKRPFMEYGPTKVIYYEFSFNVTVKTDGNGTLNIIKENFGAGEEIELNVLPNDGYVLESIKITDVYGNEISYTDNKFIMPSSDVVIEVTFVKQEENPDTSDYLTIVLLIILVVNVIYKYRVSKKSDFLN